MDLTAHQLGFLTHRNDSHYGMADFVIYRTDPKCQMVLDPIPKSLSQKLFGSIDIHSIFFKDIAYRIIPSVSSHTRKK
jgi:hypothetical protein